MRENAEAKARRYLTEARLLITQLDGDTVTATCRGSGEIYQLGHDPETGWHCDCPAHSDGCSHLQALQLVTVRRRAT